MEHLILDDAKIEYEVYGAGEPALLIHLSLIADGLGCPLVAQQELLPGYRLIHYHRRGYMGSTLGSEPLSVSQQANDAAALLRHLEVKSAHVVGHSFGGLIALQLAVDAPGWVGSLALLEPPIRTVPSGKESFERNVFPMMKAYQLCNKWQAVEIFSKNIFGPSWQSTIERAIPGGIEQAMRDVDIFMKELAAFQDWQFGDQQVALIRQPVLSVLGVLEQNNFMIEVRKLLHSWFPQTEDLDINATHLLQIQDPQGVAKGLAQFFARHPLR